MLKTYCAIELSGLGWRIWETPVLRGVANRASAYGPPGRLRAPRIMGNNSDCRLWCRNESMWMRARFVTGQTESRIWLTLYLAAGSAAGAYLVYVVVGEFGSAASLDAVGRSLPTALAVIVYFPLPLWAATQSWRLLFPPGEVPGLRTAVELTWIGLSVNWLLPAALVGGELVRFRLAFHRAAKAEDLVASLVGDKTIQVATQLLYAAFGLAALVWAGGHLTGGAYAAGGFMLFGMVVYLFYRLQRGGLFSGVARRLRAFAGDRERMALKAGRIDAAIDAMYRRSGRWWVAVAWRTGFRLLLAAEVALVLWWQGIPLTLPGVLALESIAQASRAAAVVIPAAIGAQETAIMAAGLVLGYPPEALIALAVVKRLRELAVGGAGLTAWQFNEARRLLRKRT